MPKTDDLAKQFSLKKPCENCPFIATDKTIPLLKGRRFGIIDSLIRGKSGAFPCHKSVFRDNRNFDDDGNYVPNDVIACPGAMAVVAKCGHTPTIVQVAERFGVIEADHYKEAEQVTVTPEDIANDGGVGVEALYDPFGAGRRS